MVRVRSKGLSRRAKVFFSRFLSGESGISISNRLFPNLESVEVQPGNLKFSTDGQMLFSEDGKELLYSLAARNKEKVVVPKTVRRIVSGAFQCVACTEIVFENPEVSVEQTTFDQSGWLEKQGDYCIVGNMFYRLNRPVDILEVPENVRRLHESAFYHSGLEKVVINDRLRQIGEYAFARCQLRQVSLPASVERLGKGSLAGVEVIDTYVGTAKGLVSAVNTVPPDVSEKRANVEWGRCMVHARHKKGDKVESFLIPESLKRNVAYHLDMAWNSDQIDYEEYDVCFEAITDSEERLEFAELGILRLQDDEDTPYVAYMRHSAVKIASRLLEAKKEKEFLAFLERGYLSESAYGKLLKIANKNGLTTCSAYLLKYQNAQGSKKTRRFSL